MYVNHLAWCLKWTQYTGGVTSEIVLLLEWALKAAPVAKSIYAHKEVYEMKHLEPR